MGKKPFEGIIYSSREALNAAEAALANPDVPSWKLQRIRNTLQSLWFHVLDLLDDTSNKQLEDICVQLDIMIGRVTEEKRKRSAQELKEKHEKRNLEGADEDVSGEEDSF